MANKNSKSDKLESIKQNSKVITLLDYRSLDLVDAHLALGNEVRDQVHKIIRHKFNRSPVDIENGIRFIRVVQQTIDDLILSGDLNPLLRKYLAIYKKCLYAWCIGVDIQKLINIEYPNIIIDGKPITPFEIGLFLQNDNSGCQTGIVRTEEDSMMLWHIEEDVTTDSQARFDKLRIGLFRITEAEREIDLYSFIYPDLLPGVAFTWRSDFFVQAVDSLYLNDSVPNQQFLITNILCWMTAMIGNKYPIENISKDISPYADGCALIILKKDGSNLIGQRIEVGKNSIFAEYLGNNISDYLFQVNLVSEKNHMLLHHQQIDRENERGFRKRVHRTTKFLKNTHPLNFQIVMKGLLCSTEGNEYSYSNKDVKAYLILVLKRNTMSAYIGGGPPRESDQFTNLTFLS